MIRLGRVLRAFAILLVAQTILGVTPHAQAESDEQIDFNNEVWATDKSDHEHFTVKLPELLEQMKCAHKSELLGYIGLDDYALVRHSAFTAIGCGHPDFCPVRAPNSCICAYYTGDKRFHAQCLQHLYVALGARRRPDAASINDKIWKEALAVLELLPDNYSVNNYLAIGGLKDWFGDSKGAWKNYERARRISKNDAVVEWMITSAASNNEWVRLAELESSIATSNPKVYETLSTCYAKAGRIGDMLRVLNHPGRTARATSYDLALAISQATEKEKVSLSTLLSRDDDSYESTFAELRNRGWIDVAEKLYLESKLTQGQNGSSNLERYCKRLTSLADWEISVGNRTKARAALSKVAVALDTHAVWGIDDLAIKSGCCEQLKQSVSKPVFKAVDFADLSANALKLSAQLKTKLADLKRIEQIQTEATSLRKSGDFEAALACFKSVLDIRRGNLKENDPLVAESLIDVAEMYATLKNPALADEAFQKSISILRNQKGCERQLRSVLENYGSFLNQIGEISRAADVYEQSKQVASK